MELSKTSQLNFLGACRSTTGISKAFSTQSISLYRGTHGPPTFWRNHQTRNDVSFGDHKYVTAPADEVGHDVEAANPVSLAPCSHRPVIVASTCSDLLIKEAKTLRASRASLPFSNKNNEIASGKPYYVLVTNLSVKQAFTPKNMILHNCWTDNNLVPQTRLLSYSLSRTR